MSDLRMSTTTPPAKTAAHHDLSIEETLRIMDVARTLRRERDVAVQQFNRDQIRTRLRERLLASTEITGDQFTEAEVEAALDQYFNNLHTYRDPPGGFSVLLAHLYIRRGRVLVLLIAVSLFLVWWIWN